MSKILKDKISILEKEVALLKKENQALKNNKWVKNKSEFIVDVPKNIKPIFDNAEAIVSKYFKDLTLKPSQGTIEINNERYLLVRASSLSNEFLASIVDLYKDRGKEEALTIGKNILFDIGHLIGLKDARKFHKTMKLKTPIDKLSVGPVHFAYTGWASVKILPESKPAPTIDFFLKYEHPYSFEADSWIKSGEKSKTAVCTMNAAYSSGWCEESYGMPLTAVEITCKAKGDKACTFIMAHPDKINSFLDKEKAYSKQQLKPEIPYFFQRKKIEEQFIKNVQIFDAAQNMAKLGSFEYDLKTQSLVWSDELYNIFQIDKKKVSNSALFENYISKIPDKHRFQILELFDRAIKKGLPYKIKHPIILNDKSTRWLNCSGTPIKDKEGHVIQIIGIAQDVTHNIIQQERLESSISEKETLLKEIHHRVKNNLQIISSLLNLQSETIKDEAAKEKYRESLGRIKSMALIHEMLYQTKNLSKLKATDYLNELVNFISETYNFNRSIKINLNIDPKIKRFDMNKAIPCGLLINELVSNAFKYAFKNKEAGEIKIQFSLLQKGQHKYRLLISDNGIGIPKHISFNSPETLGLQLVHTLASQLDGEIKIMIKNGTSFQIDFS